MTRTEAIEEAREYADRILEQARGLVRDAIEYRRLHPHRFALFHRRMGHYWVGRGKKVRARWHWYWAERYAARAWALDSESANACGIARGG